jgi:hypothetical protein
MTWFFVGAALGIAFAVYRLRRLPRALVLYGVGTFAVVGGIIGWLLLRLCLSRTAMKRISLANVRTLKRLFESLRREVPVSPPTVNLDLRLILARRETHRGE